MQEFYTNVARGPRNTLLVKGYTAEGKPFQNSVPFKPSMFIRAKPGKQTKYQSVYGDNLDRIDFDSISDANDFIRRYADVENMTIFGLQDWVYQYIYESYHKVQYNSKLISIGFLDIEVKSDEGFPYAHKAEKEVTAITLRVAGKSYVFGCGEYKPKTKDVFYLQCENEAQLLTKFLMIWNSKELHLDVITGWNVASFDIPYLFNRISKILGDEEAVKLSPFRMVRDREVKVGFGKVEIQKILSGISILDYIDLYKKFSNTPQESYKLDHIAFAELGVKKLDYSEQSSLFALYKNDYTKFIDYNIRDAELVELLEKKMGLLELVFAMAYDAGINFNDSLTTVRMWDIILHNYLMDRNRVLSPHVKRDRDEHGNIVTGPSISGGHVKDPKTGMYKWVVSFDVTSLYPSLMVLLNMSPETMRKKFNGLDDKVCLKDGLRELHSYALANNLCLSATGQTFTRDVHGFIPEIITERLARRAVFKKAMLDAQQRLDSAKTPEEKEAIAAEVRANKVKQESLKLGNNSLYGATANGTFRWFDNNFAEAITTTGRFAVQWIERDLNKQLNKVLGTKDVDYVIAIDTDSCYLNLEALVNKFKPNAEHHEILDYLTKMCKEVFEPFIDESFQRFSKHLNSYEGYLKMKREAIADRAVWTAAKHYMMNVWDNEGVRYSESKIKMVGIETVKSSTPTAVKQALKDAIKIILNKTNDDLIPFVDEFKSKFKTLSFDEIASPRSVNGMPKYRDAATIYKKGCPIGPKAALIYNNALEKFSVDNKYPPIEDGNKIKYIYLTTPNPLRMSVIGSPGILPPEFGLERYINYDLQYEKTFLNPLSSITSAIGWNVEFKSTLEAFFV
jgi:DNA polymerase elongation subunit (family B)